MKTKLKEKKIKELVIKIPEHEIKKINQVDFERDYICDFSTSDLIIHDLNKESCKMIMKILDALESARQEINGI